MEILGCRIWGRGRRGGMCFFKQITANKLYGEFKKASVYKELCEAERKKLTKKRGMAWLEGGGVGGVDVGLQLVRGYVRREGGVV